MRTSSAEQLELDYSGAGTLRTDETTTTIQGVESVRAADAPDITSNPPHFTDFSASRDAIAVTSRMAGRINAANISDEEHNLLLRERQVLLDKKFDGEITPREINRLEYVRWSLDRVEDARYGHDLDVIEGYVEKYERFLSEINNLEKQLRENLPRIKKRR